MVGGGPAGAIAAIALARLGKSVLLCEAATFPRAHIGISLSAGVRRQLAFLGLEDLLCRPCHLSDVLIERRWASATIEQATETKAIIVDRGVFDTDLLDAARRLSVHVLQPAAVRGWRRAGDGWQLDVHTDTSDLVVGAHFVVDASGRGTRFRRRQRQGAVTLAVCSRWRGAPTTTVRVLVDDSAWSWGAPTGPDSSVLVCFVDPRKFRQLSGSPHERYLELARANDALPGIGELALDGIPYVCDATPYITEGETDRLLRIGDADIALDPLSSSGVQAAIQSALAAGPIINTLLTEGMDSIAAMEFWRMRRASRMLQHRKWTSQIYAQAYARFPTSFWAERCEIVPTAAPPAPTMPLPHPDQTIILSAAVQFVSVPCLTYNLVERRECVDHPRLTEPVAFVAGIAIVPLLRRARQPVSARTLVTAWSTAVGPRAAWSLLEWAWSNAILEPVASGGEGGERQAP